jgi:hypothetical protein
MEGNVMDDQGQPDTRTPHVFRHDGKDYVSMDEYLRLNRRYRDFYEPRWTPVEERWPSHGSDVLVAYKCGGYVLLGVGEFDGTNVNDDGLTVPYFKGIRGFDVTHWMPLPQPPEVAT